MGNLFDLKESGYFYTRLSNPTNDAVANKICQLEGGTAAILTSSGQAANFYAILNIANAGDHIISTSAIYGGTYNLIANTMKQMGIEATFVEPDISAEELETKFRTNTKLVFGETLSNPSLSVLDIEKFADAAHKHGVPLIVDNTFPTPIFCRPFEWGADIIFFRVARMVMFGLYEMKDVPFHDVFFHGIVRDELGRKMSKSLGNSPDPLKLIDEYGADAIRFTMIYNTSAGQDVHFSEKLIEMGRNFANKVWNATNFVLMNLEGFDPKQVKKSDLAFELVDQWIYSRLNTAIAETESYLNKYALDEAAKVVYEFIRGDFCDWYVEMAKVRLYMNDDLQSKQTAQWVLWEVLESALRLLHPFMPFITEELWQHVKTEGETIMLQSFPKSEKNLISAEVETAMAWLQEAITAFRNIRAEANINP